MIPKYDEHFIGEVTRRIESLPADKLPLWGSLTAPGVVGHLTESMRYSMGQMGEFPTKISFMSRYVIRPLIVNGILRFPKGVKGVPLPFEPGNVNELRLAMEEYLEFMNQGSPALMPHPIFGPLTLKEWTQFHTLHFQHHLRQFDI